MNKKFVYQVGNNKKVKAVLIHVNCPVLKALGN